MRTVGNDEKRGYLFSALLLAALLPLSVVTATTVRITITAAILFVAAVLVCLFVKKRSILSFNKRQVLLLLTVIAAVYLMLLYLTGLYYGFGYGLYYLSFQTFFQYILPVAVVIIATEIIRAILIGNGGVPMKILLYLACVSAEICLGAGIGNINSSYLLVDFLSFTVLPAATANLLYHYIAKRYGCAPNIAYRLILGLYAYVIPFVSNIPVVFTALSGILLPLVSLWFIDLLFEKKRRYAAKPKSKWGYALWGATIAVMISLVMLISCQFRFGILVIATPSMTGSINEGDAVVFEEYRDQTLKEGDVIVFTKNSKSRIVHRVVDIQNINGQNRYITKGDANEDNDYGYIVDTQVVGVVKFKVVYIGYPSLWLRQLFD